MERLKQTLFGRFRSENQDRECPGPVQNENELVDAPAEKKLFRVEEEICFLHSEEVIPARTSDQGASVTIRIDDSL